MKRLILVLALPLLLIACDKPDVPTLLTWAQDGINADCLFGKGALAANICTFGTDGVSAAQAAYAKDPTNGKAAVKKILQDVEASQPQLAPYLNFVIAVL